MKNYIFIGIAFCLGLTLGILKPTQDFYVVVSYKDLQDIQNAMNVNDSKGLLLTSPEAKLRAALTSLWLTKYRLVRHD